MRRKTIVAGWITAVLCLVVGCSKESQKQSPPQGDVALSEVRAMTFLNQLFYIGESKSNLIRRAGQPAIESNLADGSEKLTYLFREDHLLAAKAGVAGVGVIVHAGKVVEWFPMYGSLPPPASMPERGTTQSLGHLISEGDRTIAFHEVSDVKIDDSEFHDSAAFPKLGYVKRKPTLIAVFTRSELLPELSNETMKAFTLWFREEDRAKLERFTRDNLGKSIAIYRGTQLVAAPYIRSPVVDGSVQLSLKAEAVSNLLRK